MSRSIRIAGALREEGENIGLHRFALFTACCTGLLIFIGGLVTSTQSGLSVPDWPTTYGWNMYAFPFSKWVGGIFYEHSHRLVASFVGFLTVILANASFEYQKPIVGSVPRTWFLNLEALFEKASTGLLVFAYNVVGELAPLPSEELFVYREKLYGFVGIRLDHYASFARTLSPRWGTVTVPVSRFRALARPAREFFGVALPRSAGVA